MKTKAQINSKIIANLENALSSFAGKLSSPEKSMVTVLDEIQLEELTKLFLDSSVVKDMNELISKFSKIAQLMNRDLKEGIKWYRLFEKEVRSDFEGLEYLYVKQWAISVEALYYYKKQKFRQAYSLTLECISLNEMLIREGISTLLFRSIEQNKNIAKISLKRGMKDQSFKQKRDLLRYFLNGESRDLYGNILKDKSLWDKFSIIRDGFAESYFVELVHEYTLMTTDKRSFFYSVFQPLISQNTENNIAISDWIIVEQFWISGDFMGFLESFIKYMQKDISKALDLTKVTLIANAKLLLDKINCDRCNQIKNLLEVYTDTNFTGFDYFKNSTNEETEKYLNSFEIAIS